jgi:hypothetical protein
MPASRARPSDSWVLLALKREYPPPGPVYIRHDRRAERSEARCSPEPVARGRPVKIEDEHLYPEIRVVCHNCADALPIPAGLNAVEAVWMHEPECRALAPDLAAFAD